MRFRRAVLQIPAKSSRSRRLPLDTNLPCLTPSEATLLQVLISLHFNFCGCTTYKKTGRGCLSPTAKFCNSLLRTAHQTRHACLAATPFLSSAYERFPSHMGVGVSLTPLSLSLPRTPLPVQSSARSYPGSYQGDCMNGRSDVLAQCRRFLRGTMHRAL